MNNYLADTTVVIEHLRGNIQAKNFLATYSPAISAVTIAELIQGARDKKELTSVSKLVDRFLHLSLDKKVTQTALTLLADFHLSHGLFFLDALIAATAIENKLILVTENVKHFRYIKDLNVVPYKEVFV